MKLTLLIAAVFASVIAGHSQSLKKYAVSNSGCSLYIYCEPKFDVDYSEDSSKVFTGECTSDQVTYGLICIKLLTPVSDMDMAEDLVISYLDYLKVSFEIITAAGYGKGHRMNDNENVRGIIDYWQDKEKANWKIKAWTDCKFIAVMYAKSKKELPETKVSVFLNGFRFQGM